MVANIHTQIRRRNRLEAWVVVAVFIVALLLGWGIKALAETRTVTAQVEAFEVRYPEGWIDLKAEPPVLLRVADRPTAMRIALTVEKRPLPPGAERPLALVMQTLAMERGGNWMAYRVLETQEGVVIGERTATQVVFAYVETTPNPFMVSAPVVMRGEDLMFCYDESVYILTVTAPESDYAQARRYLQDFARSFK